MICTVRIDGLAPTSVFEDDFYIVTRAPSDRDAAADQEQDDLIAQCHGNAG
jgi:hypothetical protein